MSLLRRVAVVERAISILRKVVIFIGARKESLKASHDPSDCGQAMKEDLVEEPCSYSNRQLGKAATYA